MPGRSAVEVFDAYLVTGGYPRLVSDLVGRNARRVVDYVHDSLADPYSPLVTTARLSLDAEFQEPQFAYGVLSAIGSSDRANPGFKDVLGYRVVDPYLRFWFRYVERCVDRLELRTHISRNVDLHLLIPGLAP